MGKFLDPNLAAAAMLKAGFKPLEPYNNTRSPWKCECLICHRVVFPTYARVRVGSKCVFCIGAKLDEKDAIQVLRFKNLEPLEPFTTVMKPWKCRCLKCGDLVQPSLNSLKKGQGGCVTCGRKVTASKQRLNEQEAEELMINAGVKPIEPYISTSNPWKSICLKCNREVRPRLSGIKQGQGGCTYCAGNKVDMTQVLASMQKLNLEPLEPYKTALSKWKCKCLICGSTVFPLYNSIQQGQGGCIKCANKLNAEKLKLSDVDARTSMLQGGFDPVEAYSHNQSPWKSRCLKCERVVYPSLNNVKNGSGCPSCAKGGFDPNLDGYFYLIQHSSWEMYQIGITNYPIDRLKDHKKLGWNLIEVRGPLDGHLTRQWETGILRMLKAKGADLSNSQVAGKFDGYSEAWSKSAYKATSILNLMKETDDFEEVNSLKWFDIGENESNIN